MYVVPRVLIVALKRFDPNGAKLSHNVDVPFSFSFDSTFLNEELQKKERTGYKESSTYEEENLLL